MVDWERLVNAVLCTAILISGIIFIINLPIYAFLVLVITAFACALIFLFYKALGDSSDKDNGLKNKDND